MLLVIISSPLDLLALLYQQQQQQQQQQRCRPSLEEADSDTTQSHIVRYNKNILQLHHSIALMQLTQQHCKHRQDKLQAAALQGSRYGP